MKQILKYCGRTVVIAGVLGLIAGCADDSPNRVTHPTPYNIPDADDLAYMIADVDTMSADHNMQRIAHGLRRATLAAVIGASEGERHEMLGSIEDADVDSAGRIFILDSQHKQLFVYNHSGEFIQNIGRPGAGPGEFTRPRELHIDRSNRIIVLDGRRASVFTARDDTYELDATVALDYWSGSLCIRRGLIYSSGNWSEHYASFVHVLTFGGEHIRSLGTTYRYPVEFVRTDLSNGPIACHDASDAVIYMFVRLPVIYGYRDQGDQSWMSMLADFEMGTMIEEPLADGSPSMIYGMLDKEHNWAIGIHFVTAEYFAVQTQRLVPEGPDSYHTYLINGQTGEGMYVGDQLPRIHAIKSGKVLVSTDVPFPQLHVLHLPTKS